MPNNVSILAYVQCMKDQTILNIQHYKMQGQPQGKTPMGLFINEKHLNELVNLEKFIKGGKK